MAKRFNYKQLEMQMEDLVQETMSYALKEKLSKSGTKTFNINTRGSSVRVKVLSISIYDEEELKAIDHGFTTNTWIEGVLHIYGNGSDMIKSVDDLRDAIAGFIRKFRNQPEQIRWMEQRVLERCVTDNGITTKTRRL